MLVLVLRWTDSSEEDAVVMAARDEREEAAEPWKRSNGKLYLPIPSSDSLAEGVARPE